MAKPPTVLLIVETSVGEINWILPVLTAFKAMFPDWAVLTVVCRPKVIFDLRANPFAWRTLTSFSTVMNLDNFVRNFGRTIDPGQIRILLKDYNTDAPGSLKDRLTRSLPGALVVNFPHSNHIFSRMGRDPIYETPVEEDYLATRQDLFLLNTKHDFPFWSARVPLERLRAEGAGAYDEWWLKAILEHFRQKGGVEADRVRGRSPIFLYASRGEHHVYLSRENYKYLLTSTMDELLAYPDSFVLIKPHPRQDVSALLNLLSPYPQDRWMITGLNLFTLAAMSDLTVSTWSSAILDSLAVNRPSIEYFIFDRAEDCWRVDQNGKVTSIYRELDLALPADNQEEFRSAVADILAGPEKTLAAQRRAFSGIFDQSQNLSKNIAAMLMKQAEAKRIGLGQGLRRAAPGS